MRRFSDLLGPTAYPGETPQAKSDKEQESHGLKLDYTVAPPRPSESFNWSMSGTHVQVSPDDHNQQFQDLEWNNFDRPHAYGKLELFYNWTANWHVYYTNLSHHIVEKRLKKYTRDQGWDFGGVLDEAGMPHTLRSMKQAASPGIGEINPGLKDWHRDEWSGTDMYDSPADNLSDFYGEQNPPDDESLNELYTCDECGAPCLGWEDLRKHIMREHVNPGHKPPLDPQPVVDLDDVLPAGFNEVVMDQSRNRMASLVHRLAASAVAPTIQGPVPFIYDIETDRIFVGHPGERHSDIQGRFTPGGIVEGMYDPRGNVQIRTETDMPYTVRHLIQLWYSLHPELKVKGLFLLVGDQKYRLARSKLLSGKGYEGQRLFVDGKESRMPWYEVAQKKYRLASANIGHRVRNLVATEPAAWSVFKALEPHGNVFAVGGAVRDVVLGKTPKDIDLMVQGIPADQVEEILEQLPGRVDLTGDFFGVFRYRDPEGNEVEIALPRTERSTGPGHRDFEVYTDPSIGVEEDLARRDFTGNAMAVNLSTGELADPYHGAEDLKSGVLRTVSDRSFPEDPLRILRTFSQVSRHGLQPDEQTHRDLAAHAPSLSELPQERLQMELDKTMSGDNPAQAITLMEETGVLQHVLPDVAATYGFDQKNKHHNYPLNEHLKLVLDNAAKLTDDVDVRWAALLHDIGKPQSQWIGEDGIAHYYQNEQGEGQQHEEVGAEMATKLLRALKFPEDRIARIAHLITNHMYADFSSMAGARRFINRVGDENADDLLRLRQADIGGKGMHDLGYVPLMQQYVQAVRDAGEATDRSQLAINGNDLIQLGIQPGPGLGRLLEYLTNLVLEDPSLNERETLLQMARQTITEGEDGTRHASIDRPEYGEVFDVDGERLTFYETRGPWFVFHDESGLEHLTWAQQWWKKVDEYRVKKLARTANILDPVRDELDPTVFNHADTIDPDVKPKIIQWVKKKVYGTMIKEGWPDPTDYLNLMLTGSLTTYQWSAESDFDISLWVDVERFPEYVRSELVKLMIHHCDGTIVPGTTHPLQCFVVNVEQIKREDIYAPGLRSSYDLDEQKWFVLPEKSRTIDVAQRWPEHIRYAKMVLDKMKLMLRYGNNEAVKIYWHFLHKQRQRDMMAGKGDYALSNIVYKMLANEGLFGPISEATGEYIA